MEVTRLAARVPGMLAVLDDMEVWQIAAALGVHDPPSPSPGASGPIRSGSGTGTVARRMRAAAEGRDLAAEAAAPDPAVFGWAAQFQAARGVTDGGTAR